MTTYNRRCVCAYVCMCMVLTGSCVLRACLYSCVSFYPSSNTHKFVSLSFVSCFLSISVAQFDSVQFSSFISFLLGLSVVREPSAKAHHTIKSLVYIRLRARRIHFRKFKIHTEKKFAYIQYSFFIVFEVHTLWVK